MLDQEKFFDIRKNICRHLALLKPFDEHTNLYNIDFLGPNQIENVLALIAPFLNIDTHVF